MTMTIDAVRKSVIVNADRERAFRVFTEGMSTWWPLDTHHLGEAPAVATVIEPQVDGRVYERDAGGRECNWGRVVTWEPPARVVYTWEINADFEPDTTIASEVEVRFTEESPGTTRVELEHRGLESFGDRAPEMAETFSSAGGWTGLLERYAKAAASAS